MGIDGEPLAGLEMSRELLPRRHERHAGVPAGQGRRRHPRHASAAARGRTAERCSSRSTATCSGTCSSSSPSRRRTWAPRAARSWSSRSRPARSAPPPSSRRVDPNDVDASKTDDRGSRIFRDSFEPGSTFKALTAATVIDAGGQTPTSTVVASSRETFPNGARVQRLLPAPGLQLHARRRADRLVERRHLEVQRAGQSRRRATTTSRSSASATAARSASTARQTGCSDPVDQWDNQTHLQHVVRPGPDHDRAGAGRRLRRDRQRRGADAAVARRVVHEAGRHRRRARRCPSRCG